MAAPSEWDTVVESWSPDSPHARLRAYSDAVTGRFVDRWLGATPATTALKTDAFDESVSPGLVPLLRSKAETLVLVDVAPAVRARAAARYPDVRVEDADVRALTYSDATFDLVVSNSTLDHFEDERTLAQALGELARVLAPRGTLLLTLDNPLNPLVATRNRLPRLMKRLGIVPYPVGHTCGPQRLRALVQETGLEVVAEGALMHVPRVFVLLWLQLRAPLRPLVALEALDSLPTRYLSGQFVAIKAQKP
jgi:SAM-dependent methyltransferase